MTVILNKPVSTASSGVTTRWYRDDTYVDSGTVICAAFPPSIPAPARTFADERATFQAMRSMLYSRYPGQWVAISVGQVVEHGDDRKAVTRRFFGRPGRGPVYIGFVGPTPTLRQVTPFRARRRA